jgi:cyclopropane fatty-acyl-phospholipid synthase-like methyltransferase
VKARKNAQEAGANLTLISRNILKDVCELESTFDFVFDWKVLHHFHIEQIDAYVANIKRMLKPGGKYFSVSYSDKDSMHPGHTFRSRLGTIFYMHSLDDLSVHMDKHFNIMELRTARIGSTFSPRFVNYALMQRE